MAHAGIGISPAGKIDDAEAVTDDKLDAEHIVPDVFDEDLVPALARAVMNASAK